MATIRVPGPPPQAFQRNRPISDLIKAQVKHFQHLEHKLQLNLPQKFSPQDLTTEAAAAQYIAEMTAALRNPTPPVQQAPTPVRVVSSPKPDSTPAMRSIPSVPKPPTSAIRAPIPISPRKPPIRQPQGIVITASSNQEKPHAKNQDRTKPPGKES